MMNSRDNSQFVIATLAEFVRVWDLGEDASLHLETTKGHATMAFKCKLGPPTAPHPPPPPSWKPRHHRGPAQREKNRQRAAQYQASKRAAATAVTSPTTLPTTAPVVTISTPSTTSLVSTPAISVPVMAPSNISSPSPVVSSASSSADSAAVPATGYGSVPADLAVAPTVDMYFDDRIKVYGFIFALVSELKSCGRRGATGPKVRCDKCQFHGSWHLKKSGLRKHRQEKHRIWECLCCGAAFPNSIDFKNHIDEKNCVLHPLGMPYLGCGSDEPHPIIWYALP